VLGELKEPLDSLRISFWRIGGRVGKMRFSLKTSQRTYGLEPGRMVLSVQGDFILTNRPIAHIFLF
jgi:hypothetical protein